MSRVSISRRLDAIRDAAERIDPQASRVFRMPPALRMRFDTWSAECARMHDEIEREHGPGASFAAYLDGTFVTPDPPRAVAAALGAADMPMLTVEMSAQEVAQIYSDYAGT
jgi:hypothetical protein